MYTLVLLTLHGSDPVIDGLRAAAPAATNEQDKPATKPQKKTTTTTKPTTKKPTTTKTTKKPSKAKPSSEPLAKPEPAPEPTSKPTPTGEKTDKPSPTTPSSAKPSPGTPAPIKPSPAKSPTAEPSSAKPPSAKPPSSGSSMIELDDPQDDPREHDPREHDDDHGAHDDHGSHDGDHGSHDGDHGSQGDGGAHDGGSQHPPHHSSDHRYARPTVHDLPENPHAHAPPPAYAPYRGWYTHWWIHPYWRWQHATVVIVRFPFAVNPWADAWIPPARAGWEWIPGHFEHGFWVPGHWAPVGPPVIGYVYVPGWWFGAVYVSGFYRVAERDQWRWIDGRYGPHGSYVPGHWEPTSAVPDGYTWEPGFFDGETWIEGYWRPLARAGYLWIPARTTGEGVYCSGYWEPVETRADHVWVPGWFDGNQWVEGYWVSQREYDTTDPSAWEPDPGWDADEQSPDDSDPEPPVAIPVPDVD